MDFSEKYPGCPFNTELDLSGLIRYWKANLSSESFKYFPAGELMAQVEKVPELHQPIRDLKVIEKHAGLISGLLSVIFPPALTDNLLMGAHVPFDFSGFYIHGIPVVVAFK